MSNLEDTSHHLVTGKTVLGPAEMVLSLFVAVDLFALMTLRCVDVVARYAFNAPIPGASELTGLSLALMIFGALPIVTAHREHVTVDLLEMLLGRYSRVFEGPALLITSFVALALMAWRLWVKAGAVAAYGDGTSYLNVPLAPFAYFMSVMAMLAAATVALQIVAFFRSTPNVP